MKSIVLDPKPESKNLEMVCIQGLYSPIRAHEKFWTLRARIELAVFKKTEQEVNRENE
ncbi:MAG: hypothetical protein ABIH76_02225 [Candidatus Bathyarchaeota archaeon]